MLLYKIDGNDLILARTGTHADLFGPKTSKVSNSGTKLLECYRRRLPEIFGNVITARLIKNTRGNPLYYPIWACPHKKGLEGTEHIMSKCERAKR